jgi:hypothetical protein
METAGPVYSLHYVKIKLIALSLEEINSQYETSLYIV